MIINILGAENSQEIDCYLPIPQLISKELYINICIIIYYYNIYHRPSA
jgi:hypothetical protein